MGKHKRTYGQTVRARREALGIGLSEFARRLKISRSYQSIVERDETTPPTEEQIKRTAELLELNEIELLALASKIPSEVKTIILERPALMCALLRIASLLDDDQLKQLILNQVP